MSAFSLKLSSVCSILVWSKWPTRNQQRIPKFDWVTRWSIIPLLKNQKIILFKMFELSIR